MPQRSPTLEGFRTILRRPSFGFAEFSWRWSFGAAAALLITFSFFEYLDTLPVSRLDLFLLKSRHPTLIGQAIAHIFHGSSMRIIDTSVVLALGLATMWIAIAALGRAATVKALVAYFRADLESEQKTKSWRLRSLLGLNFFRVAATLAATTGGVAALLLGGAVSPAGKPAPGAALLVMLTVFLLVGLAWLTVNWFLSLASVFAVVSGRDTFGSISDAVSLCRDQTGSVLAAGTWFALCHITAFFIATSIVAFPLGFAAILPPAVTLGGVLVVTLLYFAVADFLYMGRLAAYVAMLEFPPASVALRSSEFPVPILGQPLPSALHSAAAIDQEELILSDIPLPS